MQFVAKAKFIRYSPYKLRPIADVVRGKSVQYALNWLATYSSRRALPIRKAIASAAANAKNLENIEADTLLIKDIRIDQGPMYRFYKPGPMGRAMMQRKKYSHISVNLEPMKKVKEV